MYTLYLLDKCYLLLFKKGSKIAQCEIVSLNNFGTVVLAFVIENILVDRCTKGTLWAQRSFLTRLRSCCCFLFVWNAHKKEAFTFSHSKQRQVFTGGYSSELLFGTITACLL